MPKQQITTSDHSDSRDSSPAMEDLRQHLINITKDVCNGIMDILKNRHIHVLNGFFESREQNGKNQKNPHFSPLSHVRQLCHGKSDEYLYLQINDVTCKRFENGVPTWFCKPDAEQIITARAVRQAEQICSDFIAKNLAKLAPIIKASGDCQDMRTIGRNMRPDCMEGRIRISFRDGSGFEARSQGVMSESCHGKSFMRYPLTFHDVVMADGTSMNRPSEKKMNTLFIRNDALPEP